MSEEKPLLVLDPKSELHFKGPFTEVVTSHLKLSNPSDRRICFKVKTTAPKRYCVRPNNGIVEGRSSALIAVMLQPFDIESQTDRNKHKFMVQTIFVPDGDVNQDALWREASPDAIHDSKLKCVFDVAQRPGGGGNNVPSPDPAPATVMQQQPLTASTWASGTTPVNNTTNVSSPVNVTRSGGRSDGSVMDEPGESGSCSMTNNLSGGRGEGARVPGSRIGDDIQGSTLSASPSLSPAPPISASPSKTERSPVISGGSERKVVDETGRLRDEISRLRSENMHLKEEGLRQRIRSGESGSRSSSGSTTADLLKARNPSLSNSSNGLAGQEVLQLLMNPNVLAIGLVLFVIGIVLGKVVF